MEDGLPMDSGASTSKAKTPLDNIQEKVSVIVDNVWQYVHIAAAAFLFYEDRLLCLYSLLGFASLCGGVVVASSSGVVPTMGEELWRIAIPASAILSVTTSLGCRVAGWISTKATVVFCLLLPLAVMGLTTVTLKNDKTAKLRQ
ncbi:unnamed protein product [Effrenium voratum]|nr:unnamed protein product [Effrenium voratum]|mmetsp:Transcript_116253/g.276346  ORF Transcript_116253/g.276346 Transcript_116253/m.276346 type:complete len:144 (+) Transcript_116253:79-510(+)